MAGAQAYHIAMEEVFMWSRKARQFLNKCRDFMAKGDVRPEGYGISPLSAMPTSRKKRLRAKKQISCYFIVLILNFL